MYHRRLPLLQRSSPLRAGMVEPFELACSAAARGVFRTCLQCLHSFEVAIRASLRQSIAGRNALWVSSAGARSGATGACDDGGGVCRRASSAKAAAVQSVTQRRHGGKRSSVCAVVGVAEEKM